jgi:hypothetical protein
MCSVVSSFGGLRQGGVAEVFASLGVVVVDVE